MCVEESVLNTSVTFVSCRRLFFLIISHFLLCTYPHSGVIKVDHVRLKLKLNTKEVEHAGLSSLYPIVIVFLKPENKSQIFLE